MRLSALLSRDRVPRSGGHEGPVDVDVDLPDGEQRSRTLVPATDYLDSWVSVWRSEPGDPSGTYQITAQQGDLVAADSFEVIPPEDRGLSIEPTNISAGEVADIVLFGYEPLSDVGLHFYRLEGDEYVYVGTETVTADADGWGSYALATSPTDPSGSYLVHTTPPTALDREGIPPAYPPFVFGGFTIEA